MFFKTPQFWQKKSILSRALLPISYFYNWGARIRYFFQKSKDVGIPVICVGNVVLGGAGKTPTVIALVELLRQMKKNPHVISKGYGGTVRKPTKVNLLSHDYLQVGDEPLLLSKVATTWVGRDRYACAIKAIEAGADIIILDDGLQSKNIKKDLSILVVDQQQGFGNGFILPAGPLRERLECCYKRVQFCVVIGEKNFDIPLPILSVNAHIESISQIPAQPVVGFAGLGHPQKFLNTLKRYGFEVMEFLTYPDHHPYTILQIKKLLKIAKANKARLITTEKDFTRVPYIYREQVLSLDVKLRFDDPIYIKKLLTKHLDL